MKKVIVRSYNIVEKSCRDPDKYHQEMISIKSSLQNNNYPVLSASQIGRLENWFVFHTSRAYLKGFRIYVDHTTLEQNSEAAPFYGRISAEANL